METDSKAVPVHWTVTAHTAASCHAH